MPNRVNRLMEQMEKDALGRSGSLIFVGYRGLKAAHLEELRRMLRAQALKVQFMVRSS